MQWASSTARSDTSRPARVRRSTSEPSRAGAQYTRVSGPPRAAVTEAMAVRANGPPPEAGARMPPRRSELRAVRPVHRIRVAALEALHLLRLARRVLAFLAPRAREVRLVDHAPGLGAIRA